MSLRVTRSPCRIPQADQLSAGVSLVGVDLVLLGLLQALIDLLLGLIVLFLGELLGVQQVLLLDHLVRVQLILLLVRLILVQLVLQLLILLLLSSVDVVGVTAILWKVLQRLHRRRVILGDGCREAGRKGRKRWGRRGVRVDRPHRRGCDSDLACARR